MITLLGAALKHSAVYSGALGLEEKEMPVLSRQVCMAESRKAPLREIFAIRYLGRGKEGEEFTDGRIKQVGDEETCQALGM